ncbi:MAG: cystathionine gamma-synthase [Saprospiraceae bacterium]|nr:MAG: cystathionine gamma-synthase [Saprospiraceae bacterium]
MHLSEILIHLAEDRQQYEGAVSPPIYQTSNFAFDNVEAFRQAIGDEWNHHIYTRGNNPTVEILRKKLAALEGAEDALVFPSGAAATAMTVLSLVKAGQHVLCVEKPYSWTKTLVAELLPRFGIEYDFVDGTDTTAIEAAVRPNTALLYLESPNSMTFELQDLEACAQLARRHGFLTLIDNSNCTPLFQQPIRMGIDLVMHTGTKYLNGHSDVVCGVVCARRELIEQIFHRGYMTMGNIVSPHDAWLILRGLRTLELRLRRSYESALTVARWLEAHPRVERVLFPMLPSFPQYELARRQMSGCAGLVSFYLKNADVKQTVRFANSLERFLLAVSWGGHESLVMPMAAFYDLPGHAQPQLPPNLIRLYIGLEDPQWLIEDIARALDDTE